MKKERRKEHLKSIILIALVISSLIFTSQIWFNEKLWPEGYNFFVGMRVSAFDKIASFFGADTEPEKHTSAKILSPLHLAVYTVKDFDHAMAVLNESSDNYSYINEYVTNTISYALARDAKGITRVDESIWRKALFTRGIYVDYGVTYKSASFLQLMGTASSPITEYASSLRRFIITSDDSLVSDVSVYLIDEASGSFYKISTGLDKNTLTANIAMFADEASANKRFSYSIGADVSAGMAGEVVFAPYLILDDEKSQYKTILSVNPVMRSNDASISAHMLDRIFKAFSINPKTVRKSVIADGSTVFVHGQATLKISPDGVLSYTTAAGGKGLTVTSSAPSSASSADVLSGSRELLEAVAGSIINSDGTRLYLSNLSEEQNRITADFDYMCSGVPVIFGAGYKGQHAVTIEFENGYLKNYRQILRRYEVSDNVFSVNSTYDANIFSSLSEQERRGGISEMFVAYKDDGSAGEKLPSWFVKLENSSDYRTDTDISD